jgi:hypothetical protein
MSGQSSGGSQQNMAQTVDVPMAVEKAWHLIQTKLPVASWAKGHSSHEFSLINETGHFTFSLVPAGHHECAIIYRTDLDYSEELFDKTADLLTTEIDRKEEDT